MASRARSVSAPITTRSGCMKSSMAAPSRKNSGLETTSIPASGRSPGGDLRDARTGPHRHRRFGHQHGVAPNRRRDLPRRLEDIAEVRMAVAAPARRSDGDKDDVGFGNGLFEIGREGQAARSDIARHKVVETRLVDRHFAPAKPVDPVRVLVHADRVRAELGETGAGHQADIARAHHRNAHVFIPAALSRAGPCFRRSGPGFPLPPAQARALRARRRYSLRGSPSCRRSRTAFPRIAGRGRAPAPTVRAIASVNWISPPAPVSCASSAVSTEGSST